MIIKSKSYKTDKSVRAIITYVMREAERDGSFVLTRFIEGKDYSSKEIANQYLENEKHRKHIRKNNVKAHMEILSFHPKDTPHLNNSVLQKIARKYISLRSNLAISLATVHRDTKHVHLHFVFSSIEWRTGRSTRLSKSEFSTVKRKMEAFQKQRFPQITYSTIDHSAGKKKSF